MKKLTFGAWAALATAVLGLAACVAYTLNVNGAGYFKGNTVTNLVLFSVLAVVLLVAAVCVSLSSLDRKIKEVCSGICLIAAAALLAAAFINLTASRVEGLGFIYFSNPDVILEVQTPENLASATGTITSMVLYGVAMVCSIVTAFFRLNKKNA